MKRRMQVPALILFVFTALAPGASAQAPDLAEVDGIFAAFAGDSTPGCTVAGSRGGMPVFSRAYGMADLEHDVPLTVESVIEAGSVSKQFTAAAVGLLVLEGEVSLDEDVRKYIPEVPDYGTPITIRHLMTHTSGLRDWGSVVGIGGWPRGRRMHTHEHMLDVVSRQRALNYEPGEHYSYTNTGYNLQAVLVERVSGMPFAEFSKQRLFEPLGMTRTEWRDDYTRIVEDRAIAYSRERDGWHQDMPFENVHGNGGLLTTVGDLMKWNRNLDTGDVGGPELLEILHRQMVLNNGRTIAYAGGLSVGDYRGVRMVSHSGATAGYRAFLTRFPERGVSVAVLCNAGNANAGAFAMRVSERMLGDALAAPEPEPRSVELPAAELERRAGMYRNTRTNGALVLSARDGALRIAGGPPLTAVSGSEFRRGGNRMVFSDDTMLVIDDEADTIPHVRVSPAQPSAEQLAAYQGRYTSDEAETSITIRVDNGRLVFAPRFGNAIPLAPTYAEAFAFGGNVVRFLRDDAGDITHMSIGQSRVWDIHFLKDR